MILFSSPSTCRQGKNIIIPVLLLASFFLIGQTLFAGSEKSSTVARNTNLQHGFEKKIIISIEEKDFSGRLLKISGLFLNLPYRGGPLGEGLRGKYDQDPLYRFDCFDCTTYVETVLALAKARSFPEFKNLINMVRYRRGIVSYRERNHFTSLDWIANNIQAGFTEDITRKIGGKLTRLAKCRINKYQWYQNKKKSELRLFKARVATESLRLIKQFREEGRRFPQTGEKVELPYILIKSFFSEMGDAKLLSSIPTGVIINIVRPDWDLRGLIGTKLLISHQLLGIRKNDGKLYVRHASSLKKKVVEESFLKYLGKYQKSYSIKGININLIKS
ncbi:N-acetylmuramoyl-L-alanine amidase-like domain-containing protein [Candidatus Riflebacteria bacterium]